jgi:Kef-type K+ transport system membrane component KefB
MANYLLDIVILLTAALVAVPLFRAAGFGAELGVILLLFVIGIELRPARLWRMRRMVFGLGTLQVLITGAFLTIGAHVPLLAAQEFAIGADIAFALLETAAILLLVVVVGRYLLQPILERVTRARSHFPYSGCSSHLSS